MYCGQCGKEIKPEHKFCLYCGASVIQEKNILTGRKNKASLKKNVVVGVVSILVCVSVASGAILVSGGSNKKDKENISSQEGVQKEQEVDVSGGLIEYPDMHSIWIDGFEVRIIKYIDTESMLVKLQVGTSLIQAVVPRSLEEEAYVASYYTETWNGVTETALRFTSKEKNSALLFSCTTGENLDVLFQEDIDSIATQENAYEFESVNNGNGVIGFGTLNDIALSKYDEKTSLSGYVSIVYDSEKQMVVAAGILDAEENRQEAAQNYLQQIIFDKVVDEDFVYYVKSLPSDYEERIEAMYQKYDEILDSPTEYLQNNYEAVAEEYADYYIWDLTDDGIPEIIFMGSQHRICIVGEKNAINLVGDFIAWSKESGEIYVRYTIPGELTWNKYKIMEDNGYLSLETLSDECLEISQEYIEGELVSVYTLANAEISEEEFCRISEKFFLVDIPSPKLRSTSANIISRIEFYRSTMCLSDEDVSNN